MAKSQARLIRRGIGIDRWFDKQKTALLRLNTVVFVELAKKYITLMQSHIMKQDLDIPSLMDSTVKIKKSKGVKYPNKWWYEHGEFFEAMGKFTVTDNGKMVIVRTGPELTKKHNGSNLPYLELAKRLAFGHKITKRDIFTPTFEEFKNVFWEDFLNKVSAQRV